MSGQITTQPPVEILVQQDAHLEHCERVLTCFLQQRDHLFTADTRKSLQEVVDRVTRFEMIEQTLHGLSCPGKN